MIKDTKEIPVWDIVLRLFHWLLVVSFIIAYASSEDENPVHIYSGYLVLGLITFRLLWGIIGTKHARFTDFIYSPDKIISYIKSLQDVYGEYEQIFHESNQVQSWKYKIRKIYQ